MTSPSRKADLASILLLAGLFLIWNWRLASAAALSHQHVVAGDLLSLFAWKSLAFAGLGLGLFAVLQSLQQTALGLAYALVFWLFGAGLVVAVRSGAALQMVLHLILILALGFLVHNAITRHRDLAGRMAVVFGAVMVAMQAPGLMAVESPLSKDAVLTGLEADLPPPSADIAQPHIIYIVPDRYASNATLRTHYDYSNAPFTDALEAQGFHVWDDQNANYPNTFMSLASSLNGTYLDPVLEQIPDTATSFNHLTPLIQDFAARRALQARGYAFTHIGAWWPPTEQNQFADRNFKDGSPSLDLLTKVYLNETPLTILRSRAEARKTGCEIVADKAALVREQVRSDAPQFVFWHAFVTHDPYMFAPDGSCRNLDDERHFFKDYAARSAVYLQHIEQFNRLMLELIETVRAEASRDVIFVIQSDEGPYPQAQLGATDYDFLAAPRAAIQRKHGVFNAIYLPSGDYAAARETGSPVNNFRLIFRELTGQAVPLLPDRAYTYARMSRPYELNEVSAEVWVQE